MPSSRELDVSGLIFFIVLEVPRYLLSFLFVLQEFISCSGALHELRSQKYFAESFKKDGQIGVAIGVLRDALNKAKKKMPVDDPWKSSYGREIENAGESLRKLESENDFVWREKIPMGDELPFLQGNKIVKVEPYMPKRWERVLVFKL